MRNGSCLMSLTFFQDDVIVCPQLLSASTNLSYVDKYLFLGAASMEQHAILTIRIPAGVKPKDLEAGPLSRYFVQAWGELPMLGSSPVLDWTD